MRWPCLKQIVYIHFKALHTDFSQVRHWLKVTLCGPMLLKLWFNFQKYQTSPVPDEVENELWGLRRLWGATQRYPHSSAALLVCPEPKRFFFLCADYCTTSSECKMKNSGKEYKFNVINYIYRLFLLRECSLPQSESVANFCCIPRFLQH